jgi:glucosyl-3-phosphoglycerate phosphatase
MGFLNSNVNPQSLLVVVARHGTTLLNSSGCFRGSANPGLDAQGIRDAKNLAKLLEPYAISRILTSDRLRATQTAEIVGQRKRQPVCVTESLRALNVGRFSGQKRTRENVEELQRYLADRDEPIPGGESLNRFKARIRPCLADAAEAAMGSGAPVLLIAHSSIVHELGSYIHGDHRAVLVKPGGIAVMHRNHCGKPDAAAVYRVDHERIQSGVEFVSERTHAGAIFSALPFSKEEA